VKEILMPVRLFLVSGLALWLSAAAPLAAATIAVTTALDVDLDDGACALREAIVAANDDAAYHGCPAGSGPDRIVFELAPLPATIALQAALPPIDASVLLRGPAPGIVELDGQGLWPILDVSTNTPGVWFGIEDLMLVDGAGAGGGALVVGEGTRAELRRVRILGSTATVGGGAIWVAGTLAQPSSALLVDCEIWGNTSSGASGGGALRILGPGASVAIRRSVVAANTAESFNGGAVAIQNGELALDRVTLSGNSADGSGGAIHFNVGSTDATLTMSDSTVAFNTANLDADASGEGGGLSVVPQGGFVATLAVRNSIVAANLDNGATVDPDLFFSNGALVDWQSAGFNLIGSNAGATGTVTSGLPNAEGDYVGSAAAALDPRLDILGNWGDEVLATHRPLLSPLSPAIDAGSCPGSTGDQRRYGDAGAGLRRVDLGPVANGVGSDGCDIGAHERAGAPGADLELFTDGFEAGHTLLWSSEEL
jgi:predicted outer membrane repeat protein